MEKAKKYTLNALIGTYIFLIYFAGVPATNMLITKVQTHTRPIIHVLGVWPSWSMFAPNPIKFDSRTFIHVKYEGGEEEWVDMEIPLEGILSPFRAARWNKYSQDNIRSDTQKGLLRPALNYYKNKYSHGPKRVTNLALVQKWKEVPLFGDGKNLIPLRETVNGPEKTKILIEDKYELPKL